ncbi:MAG: hypothetical protein SFU57_07270 [Gemmatimonadales bacterium]|nr:hypothetical protein [Gemmatimonadales bacterium]
MLPDLSLIWAAIPLLLLPWRSAPERLGIAASRLVVTGFGLGALQVATGSLGLAELASWAAREGNAGFMALTIGVLVSGALVPTLPLSRWSDWLPGLPLLVATGLLLASVGLHRGLAVGIAIGTLPTLAAVFRRRVGGLPLAPDAQPAAPNSPGPVVLVALVAIWIIALRGGPIVVVTIGLGAAMLLLGWRSRGQEGRATWPVAAVIGAVALVLFAWLAITIAGQPFVALRGYSAEAPLSPAAEQWLAMLLAVSILGTFAPWPLHRLADARATFPLAIAFSHAAATMVVPMGIRGWLPLLTIVLVPSAVFGVVRRQWAGAAGALAALAAFRATQLAPFAALAVVCWPTLAALAPTVCTDRSAGGWVTFPRVRIGVTLAAVGAALTVAVVLHDEVLLGTILAAGLALAAPLADRADSEV